MLGADVMITIFNDFPPSSAKNLAFYLKTNVIIKLLHKLEVFWDKNAHFLLIFYGENI
jgi:hypothetical protein